MAIRLSRRLNELAHHAIERLENAFYEVAEDIRPGHEIPVEHLEHLARAFEVMLLFIRQCIVPLVDNPDELSTVLELEGEPSYLQPHGARRALGAELYEQAHSELAQKALRHNSIETTHDAYSDIQAGGCHNVDQ